MAHRLDSMNTYVDVSVSDDDQDADSRPLHHNNNNHNHNQNNHPNNHNNDNDKSHSNDDWLPGSGAYVPPPHPFRQFFGAFPPPSFPETPLQFRASTFFKYGK